MATNEPEWVLSDEWGVSRDTYNWTLYRRGKNKDGGWGIWKAKKYYATLPALMEGLWRLLQRTNEAEPDQGLMDFVEDCLEELKVYVARGREILAELEKADA